MEPFQVQLAVTSFRSRRVSLKSCRAARLCRCRCAEAHLQTRRATRPAQQPSEQRGSATSAAVHQNQTGSGVMSALLTAYLL